MFGKSSVTFGSYCVSQMDKGGVDAYRLRWSGRESLVLGVVVHPGHASGDVGQTD